MNFQKIVCIDKTGLEPWALNELKIYAEEELVVFEDFPGSDDEIIHRAKDASALFVSWNTPLRKEVLDACPKLQYIGMCCSLYDEDSANVDIRAARVKNIEVRGVRDYGDEGLVEFIISELIRLCKGLGEYQWKEEATELTEKKLGIIGFGTTGKMLAQRAAAFGMEIFYYSRTPRDKNEEKGATYLPLDELLQKVDIISTHLPRNTIVLGTKEFSLMGAGKILVNTSLSATYELEPFLQWIKQDDNFGIFDGIGIGDYQVLSVTPKVIYTKKVTGFTREARVRLSKKVLDNVRNYLNTGSNP